MTLTYCPNCGVAYIDRLGMCISDMCQATDTWIPPPLETVARLELLPTVTGTQNVNAKE